MIFLSGLSKKRSGLKYLLIFAAGSCVFYLFPVPFRLPAIQNVTSSKPYPQSSPSPGEYDANSLTPAELMSRPFPAIRRHIPKLFHQSWSSRELPAKFRNWSKSCREMHADWEWVLWTDEDNDRLFRNFFPRLVSKYESLPGPIYRADMARYAYMFLFGGVYADLDTECLRPTDELFKEYNITTLQHTEIIAQSEKEQENGHDEIESPMKAFFGEMATNRTAKQSIPNAWMASTPAHPFFLVTQWVRSNSWLAFLTGPEYATGPGALYKGIHEYQKEKYHLPEALNQWQRQMPKMIPPLSSKSKHEIVVLPSHYVYPYTWDQDVFEFTGWCSAMSPGFNATKCKELTNVDQLGSYSITYWSQTWTRTGHNDDSVAKVSS